MIRLVIVVEGRTEEEFVKLLLAAHLLQHGVLAIPRVLGQAERRGGNVSVERLVTDLAQLSYDFDAVTTLVDFYGFRQRPTDDVRELEQFIDDAYARSPHRQLRGDRVFAYVQRHEFEALLFSDVRAFARAAVASSDAERELAAVRDQFASPEDINDRSDTAPSKRIASAIPDYDKVLGGALAAEAIGLDAMRRECPRFSAWMNRLESLDADD